MKKILLVIFSALLAIAVYGQNDSRQKSVAVSHIELERIDNNAVLTFSLYAGEKVTKKNYNLIITPVLSNGKDSIQLSSIVVQGKRAKVNAKRHRSDDRRAAVDQYKFVTQNGGVAAYNVTFPYKEWMRGSNLYLNGINVGCCSATEASIGLIAENVFWFEPEMKIIEVPVVANVLTAGDMLSQKNTFIVPLAVFEEARRQPEGNFDYNMPLNMGKGLTASRQKEVERFINKTRDGSLSIHFHQGKHNIDRSLRDNNQSLVELVSTVHALLTANDSRITRVVITGLVSPEGSLEFNDRLAWDRAVAVKNFLCTNTGIDPGVIHIYNGSVDWFGLRQLVAQSNMHQKSRIIDIIDNVPIWDSRRGVGRHSELMSLDGGEPYRYMYREFFPLLRQAAFIKIYYENE